eukprot:TRINITY_DN48190_c0_g1_i1.p1 TRINITY_DN48190_c0_g1~~TRINITY_DN48190_c0_g1_i1.p1  ORF type:complete len:574 (+),score=67.99 TRINITY_DN48190_c0_g1_i1:224-1723(+)
MKERIVLNVGGTKFHTTKPTLMAEPDSFFCAMLASGAWQPDDKDDEASTYFIDRAPTAFPFVLQYLRRDPSFSVGLEPQLQAALLEEADFYQLQNLQTSVRTGVKPNWTAPASPTTGGTQETEGQCGTVSYGHADLAQKFGSMQIQSLKHLEKAIVATLGGTGRPSHSERRAGSNQKSAFKYPTYCCYHEGEVFVADSGNLVVRAINLETGETRRVAGTGNAPLKARRHDGVDALTVALGYPTGIAVLNGSLYICDQAVHAIQQVDLVTGLLTTFLGTPGKCSTPQGTTGGFVKPLEPSVLVSELDTVDAPHVMLADPDNHCLYFNNGCHIQSVDIFSGIVKLIAKDISSPNGLALDVQNSTLFISEGLRHTVASVYLPSLQFVTLAGTSGKAGLKAGKIDQAGKVRLNIPAGLVYCEGYLYITDQKNHCVRSIDFSTGNVLQHGLADAGYAGDKGPASGARYCDPVGLTLGPDGRLFVVDCGNHCIRQIVVKGTELPA